MKTSPTRLAIAATAVTICVATVSACSSTAETPATSSAAGASTGSSGAAATSVAAQIDPCVDVAPSCVHVADADIDGDRTPDQIGVAPGTTSDTVVVGISGKRYRFDQQLTSPGYTDARDVYRGSFQMSRAQGSDIVLHLVQGQGNAEQFAVITWDGEQLVALPRPPTADYQGGRELDIWYLGSSHGKIDTVVCRQPGDIAYTTLTAATAEGMPVPGGGRREENYYVFSGSGWQPNGSRNVADTSFSYQFDAHTQAFRCDDQGRSAS